MITREQKEEILKLTEELLVNHGDYMAVLETGWDWDAYEKDYKDSKVALEQYLEGIVA